MGASLYIGEIPIGKVNVGVFTDKGYDTSTATITPDEVLQGEIAFGQDGKVVGTMPNNGSVSATLDKDDPLYIIPSGFHDGTGKVQLGDVAPKLQKKSVNPSERKQIVAADSAYDGLSEITVNAIPSDYVGSNIEHQDANSLTVQEETVIIPAGYYETQVTQSVASGTAGTPTATKGAVNNHTVTVTPSVTNTTGYITGGTQTGVAITVSASELVSGSLEITENGPQDVTNYKTVNVNVEGINTSDATATATDMIEGATAYVNGEKIVGIMPDNGEITGSIDGLNVTQYSVPSGYTRGGTVQLTQDIENALDEILGGTT